MSITDTSVEKLTTFRKVDVKDVSVICPILSAYPPYSDFNLLSLMCWDTQQVNSYAVYRGNLVIKIKDYLEDRYLYSFLGSNEVSKTAEEILCVIKELNLIPESVVQHLDSKKFNIEEDESSFDYVINTKELTRLAGGKYKSIRRQVRKFTETYPQATVKELNLGDRKDRDSVINLTHSWCSTKGFDDQKTNEDIDSIDRFIHLSPHFNTLSLGVFVDGVLVAFNLNELLENSWVMGHFGKAQNLYEGCSVFLEHKTSEWLLQKGYQYVNIQQDAGLSGLREQKRTLHPEFFLKKYTVRLR